MLKFQIIFERGWDGGDSYDVDGRISWKEQKRHEVFPLLKKGCQCKKDCQLVYLNMLKSRSPQSRNILAATVSSGWNRGRLATIIDYFILRLWKITSCCKCLVVVLFDEIKWQKAPRLDTNSMMNSVRRRQQSTNYTPLRIASAANKNKYIIM